MTELKGWVHDYTEWKKWSDKWLNKREYGWLAVRERRPRPDPPCVAGRGLSQRGRRHGHVRGGVSAVGRLE